MRTIDKNHSANMQRGSTILTGLILLTFLATGCENTEVAVVRNDARFQTDVLQSDQPVLVDFYKVGCSSCKTLEPTIQKLANEYDGRAVILKFELMTADSVVTEPEIKKKYDIAFFPTVILFHQGKEVHRWILDYDIDRYRKKLDEYAAPQNSKE